MAGEHISGQTAIRMWRYSLARLSLLMRPRMSTTVRLPSILHYVLHCDACWSLLQSSFLLSPHAPPKPGSLFLTCARLCYPPTAGLASSRLKPQEDGWSSRKRQKAGPLFSPATGSGVVKPKWPSSETSTVGNEDGPDVTEEGTNILVRYLTTALVLYRGTIRCVYGTTPSLIPSTHTAH
jgi:hypothetical protein